MADLVRLETGRAGPRAPRFIALDSASAARFRDSAGEQLRQAEGRVAPAAIAADPAVHELVPDALPESLRRRVPLEHGKETARAALAAQPGLEIGHDRGAETTAPPGRI